MAKITKIQLFEKPDRLLLQKQVNAFLEQIPTDDIISIHYDHYMPRGKRDEYDSWEIHYTVMVRYLVDRFGPNTTTNNTV